MGGFVPLLHIYMRIKKGFYKPKNISKYKGDYRKIFHRSGLELKFMRYLDGNDSILKWSSEEIVIPYRSPIDGKVHRYFPDFWVKTSQGETLIEIKSKIQTKHLNRNQIEEDLSERSKFGGLMKQSGKQQ